MPEASLGITPPGRLGDGPPPEDAEFRVPDANFDFAADEAGGDAPSQMMVDSRFDLDQQRQLPSPGAHAPQRHGVAKGGRSGAIIAGWVVLALFVIGVLGVFFTMPNAVASALPGATRVYRAMGVIMPGGAPLTFKDVHYAWTTRNGQTMLLVEGNIVNLTGKTVTVPNVLIRLLDKDGKKISEWMSPGDNKPLAARGKAPFATQIPTPPPTVKSFKVHFQKAS